MFSNQALRKLIIPLFMEQILIVFVGIITTMMISYAGEAAMSGVSLVDMINFLLIFVLAALATGGAVVVSQYIGHKEKDQACKAASQLITITAIFSMIIMLLVIFFHKPTLWILFGNIENDVMAAAITYFVFSGLSYPFLGIYNSCAALFRSIGKSHITMNISIIMNLINVAGNAIGIFLFHAGVTGVGIATLISRAAAALIMINLSLNKKNVVYIRFSEIFSWNVEMIRKILNIAIPNGIENGIFQLGRLIIISIISAFGTTQIAANGVANSLVNMAVSFGSAMNLAIVTVIGQCVGAGDYLQANYYTKKLVKITYIGTLCINLGMILILPWILKLYTLSAETYKLTYVIVLIHNIFAILLWPISFTLSNGLRAAGDVRFPMIISIFSMFAFRVTFAYVLGVIFNMGVIGIWIAMVIDWAFRSIIFIVRFKSGKWMNFRVI
ncbi:MATE family efflux transporter [Caldicellulosiruptoraceae bacterium PP1]